MAKVYIASSWKNEPNVRYAAALLRNAGHEVDDFTDDSKGRYVFSYRELGDIQQWNARTFLQLEQAQKAFREDRKWINWADGVLLLLPSGRSAHLEAGFAVGRGKFLIIYQGAFPPGEFDVMYGFANLVTDDFNEVLHFLKRRERHD